MAVSRLAAARQSFSEEASSLYRKDSTLKWETIKKANKSLRKWVNLYWHREGLAWSLSFGHGPGSHNKYWFGSKEQNQITCNYSETSFHFRLKYVSDTIISFLKLQFHILPYMQELSCQAKDSDSVA